jgi:hypothetical protein
MNPLTQLQRREKTNSPQKNLLHFSRLRTRLFLFMFIPMLAGALSWPTLSLRAQEGIDAPAAPEWLEPKGLNIVDMVGLVPEDHLRDAIVVFSGEGLVQYVFGQRQGSRVTIDARIYTKQLGNDTYFNCLGQWAYRDQWPSVTPASTMRVYENGVEITDQVRFAQYYPAGQRQPENGASTSRYNRTPTEPAPFTADGALDLDANMGCVLAMPGSHPELTATFVIPNAPASVRMESLGQEIFQFHSYIGPGDAGRVNSLRSQMSSRYGDRHDKFTIHPPADADYMLVTFPPTPVSPYPTGPVTGPSSGTYRLAQGHNILSVDHVNSVGMPIRGQWRDADQSGGASYLPQIGSVDTIASPEYFVPTGVAYDPCMSDGGCPDSLLDRIYNGEMTLTVRYYRVERITDGLDRIPLRQVGTGWSRTASRTPEQIVSQPPSWTTANYRVFIAAVINEPPQAPPDDAEGCPCGWFDANGAMLDFIPGP